MEELVADYLVCANKFLHKFEINPHDVIENLCGHDCQTQKSLRHDLCCVYLHFSRVAARFKLLGMSKQESC